MKAEITQQQKGYRAEFTRQLAHEREQVWEMLTDNSRLQLWFDELRIAESGTGGNMIFDVGGGKSEELNITAYQEGRVLAFDWWDDHVRFEVESGAEGTTELRLIEDIARITPQTVKDLAGWHVCMDVIKAILDEEKIDREQEWEHWHSEYKRLIDSMTIEFE